MTRLPNRLLAATILLLALASPVAPAGHAALAQGPAVEQNVQAWLDAQPGPLKSLRDGERSAAESIVGAWAYYGVSPRILIALLEATSRLVSDPSAPPDALARPLGPAGPQGFDAQIDWAAAELRAGLGPYERPPSVTFADGLTLTLTLQQAPEGVAVQRFLAKGRTEAEWRAANERFGQAFQRYFENQLPDQQLPPPTTGGFLRRPWPAGTSVIHLAYFDHMYPTVDARPRDNGYVVNYLGRGNVQYDGHDGHDYYFPDQPIGTPILAAADGTAYASTRRGNGVWIRHGGGYETVYWHLDRFDARFRGLVDSGRGVPVRAGDRLGTSGMSGFVAGTPHLHFEVRRRGRQVDPYGWYGAGPDPCAAYAGCETSGPLWHPDLFGELDFAPPRELVPDTTPPRIALTIEPQPDLLFLARFDGDVVPQVGDGAPIIGGAPQFAEGRFGPAVELVRDDRLLYPTEGNLRLDAGTVAFWARLPARYPAGSAPVYLLAASAHPDEPPVYTGTLALRRDTQGPGGAARWNFWTTPSAGEAGRNDLTAPDQLGGGLHHFALSWDRAARSKALYLDGHLAASAEGVALPDHVGDLLAIGRFSPGVGTAGVAIDELAIFGRALAPAEVARLAAGGEPLAAGTPRTAGRRLRLDLNAVDDGGALVAMQVGVNGVFGDPQPYADRYSLTLPPATGSYTVGVRLFDRAGNAAVVSETVELVEPPVAAVRVEEAGFHGLVVLEPQGAAAAAQLSPTGNLDDAPWLPLPASVPWTWQDGRPRVVWVRVRDTAGLVGPARVFGPDARLIYLPRVG